MNAAALLTDGSVVTVRELGRTTSRHCSSCTAVRDVLLRVAELAGALPEVVELDINPLVLTGTGCVVVDARVRIAPAQHTDPFLRRLRTT